MSAPVPWDWPPESDRARRRSEPVIDRTSRPAVVDLRFTTFTAPRRRGLYDHFLGAFARVMIGTIKIVVGALAGLVVAGAILLLEMIIRVH
jgi:hypothetical protein